MEHRQAPQQSTFGWLMRFDGLVGEIEAHQPTELVDEPQSSQPQGLVEGLTSSVVYTCRSLGLDRLRRSLR
jgi:hypothetical protein